MILQHRSWQTYQSLINDFEAKAALRLHDDRGTLEIRRTLDPHETYKKLIGCFNEAATEELDLEIRGLAHAPAIARICEEG